MEKTMTHKIEEVPNLVRNSIDDALDRFDCNRIAEIMRFMNWKWAYVTTEDNIPEAYDIRKMARRLLVSSFYNALSNAMGDGEGMAGSGGIVARCTVYDKTMNPFQIENVDFEVAFEAVTACSCTNTGFIDEEEPRH